MRWGLVILIIGGCARGAPETLGATLPKIDAPHRPPMAALRIVGELPADEANLARVHTANLTIETNGETGEWHVVRESTGQSSRSTQKTKGAQIVFVGDDEVFVAAVDCADPTPTKGRLLIFDDDLNVVRQHFSIAPDYLVGTERTPTSLRAIALPREVDPCSGAMMMVSSSSSKPRLIVEIDHLERTLFDHRAPRSLGRHVMPE
jgi:hypothetical protein